MASDKVQQKIDRLSKLQSQVCKADTERLARYLAEGEAAGMKLSWNELSELAIRFASENDEEFFNFLTQNYRELSRREPYVPPSAVIVSTEQVELGVAAVLGIGIGWVWAWLGVSPASGDMTRGS